MVWEVEVTDEFEEWWQLLDSRDQENIRAAVAKLEERGPALSRPLADTLEGSRYPHLKELRPLGSTIRILFTLSATHSHTAPWGRQERTVEGVV
jgi:hypothetical protein